MTVQCQAHEYFVIVSLTGDKEAFDCGIVSGSVEFAREAPPKKLSFSGDFFTLTSCLHLT